MAVLDWLQQLLGGGDPEAQGAAATSTAMQPAVQQLGQLGPAWQPDTYDPGRSLAQNVLDPRGLENALNVALGVGPGAIKAYHASPYDFDAFDFSKIGTGEGAQAFGHGGYFAGNEAVSKEGYLPQLKDKVYATAGRDKIAVGDAHQQLIDAAAGAAPGLHPDQYRGIASNLLSGIDSSGSIDKYLRDYDLPGGQFGPAYQAAAQKAQETGLRVNPGHMYEVNINAEPGQFLNWDKPFNEQPPTVKSAFNSLVDTNPALRDIGGTTGEGYYQSIGRKLGNEELLKTGPRFPTLPSPGPPLASQALNQAGIPGIRYLDQGSRGAGQGTSNYVVFDPSIIEILRKYGLAGLTAGAGLLGAADQQ